MSNDQKPDAAPERVDYKAAWIELITECGSDSLTDGFGPEGDEPRLDEVMRPIALRHTHPAPAAEPVSDEQCEIHRWPLSSYRNGCPTCGAPVCCQHCCTEAGLQAERDALRASADRAQEEIGRLEAERGALRAECDALTAEAKRQRGQHEIDELAMASLWKRNGNLAAEVERLLPLEANGADLAHIVTVQEATVTRLRGLLVEKQYEVTWRAGLGTNRCRWCGSLKGSQCLDCRLAAELKLADDEREAGGEG